MNRPHFHTRLPAGADLSMAKSYQIPTGRPTIFSKAPLQVFGLYVGETQ